MLCLFIHFRKTVISDAILPCFTPVEVCQTAYELGHVSRCQGWSPAPVTMPKSVVKHAPVLGGNSKVHESYSYFT